MWMLMLRQPSTRLQQDNKWVIVAIVTVTVIVMVVMVVILALIAVAWLLVEVVL